MANPSVISALGRRLENKVALVTGGSSGIGEGIARVFGQHGAKVLIADIQDDLGQSVCKDIGSQSASYIHCDVRKETDVETAVNTIISKHGKLDIMVNNAGIVGEAKPDILDNEQSEFENLLKVNLIGVFLGIKHAARVMKPVSKGSIVNTASVCGVMGGIASHSYTSAKHGVVGLTKNTAVELGKHGVRVNCVSPYLVSTPLARDFFKIDDDGVHGVYSNLKGAILEPKDIAEAALYLASDESKYVSGHNLVVDGGFTIVNPGFCMFENLEKGP